MNETFGTMDQAYFKPKSEILAWINDSLKVILANMRLLKFYYFQLNISKVEELGSGAVYC